MSALGHSCDSTPQFDRLNYFYGRLLEAGDLRTEQAYFREKMRLHNRCLHGWGVVCGLPVRPRPGTEPSCAPGGGPNPEELREQAEQLDARAADLERLDGGGDEIAAAARTLRQQAERLRALAVASTTGESPERAGISIQTGLALDCCGNELVVRHPLTLDLWQALSVEDRNRVVGGASGLRISLCYREVPIEPVRPVRPDPCGPDAGCVHARIRDGVGVRVEVIDPDAAPREDSCDTCCGECDDTCVALADLVVRWTGEVLVLVSIDNDARRWLSRYPATVVTGMSWVQGATYDWSRAQQVLGVGERTPGLRLSFSRPVRRDDLLADGVAQLTRITGGDGIAGSIFNVGLVVVSPTADSPEFVTQIELRQASGERWSDGDRALLELRGDFVLDACCQPLDGNHVGGRVPLMPGGLAPDDDWTPPDPDGPCGRPRGRFGAWTSGNGSLGGSFEAWFTVGGGLS